MTATYDVLILGSGPGGYVAAIRAAQLGLKTGIVERETLGGICLNWGCIPTKAMLRSAEIKHFMDHASDYGLKVAGAIEADLDAIVKRSRGVAKQLNQGVAHLMKKNKIDVHMGEGRLTAPTTLEVKGKDGTQTLEARHVILATGARARDLPGSPA
ncbi:MAG: FAD-dependent oxidoreductase, partial [Erythrobacter sp.]